MSEVARLAEQKAGQQPKGLPTPTPPNGEGSSNGHAKKDVEQPPVEAPSESITKFFDSKFVLERVTRVQD